MTAAHHRDTLDVGDGIVARDAAWSFAGDVAKTFDSHISRSIPGYAMGHEVTVALSDHFVRQRGRIYELGCSTGALSAQLAERHAGRGVEVIGLDVESDMVLEAKELQGSSGAQFCEADVMTFGYLPCELVVSHYTLQFLVLSERAELLGRVYDALKPGGALVVFEKVLEPSSPLQDLIGQLYTDFKLVNGFSTEQIIGKSRTLRGVMVPLRRDENLQLMREAGFGSVELLQKNLHFEGYLAVKR